MNEFIFDEDALQQRIEAMTDAGLVMWLFTITRMTNIDERLRSLEASFVGRRAPDAELARIQEFLRMEVKNRTIAKGGTP
jgi:hypothetical protein